MAKFKAELPTELINELTKLERNTPKMMEEMTKAGAEVTLRNVRTNIPKSFVNSDIMNCLKITKIYKNQVQE